MIDLSVVIITYECRALLEQCIGSVRAATKTVSYEIVVVENGSTDGTPDWLRAQPDIRPIFNETNRGVAPARNQGLQAARGRYLLILDADTIVEPGAPDTLVACMDARPDAGLGAPKLTDADGNLQLTCRLYPTAFSKIYRRLPFRFAKKRLAEEFLEGWPHDSEREADYVIGACQIFRREAFEEVGPLDERIFYGPEDIDYCIRMWRAGWKVVYFPQAAVRHLERRITKKLLSKTTLSHAAGLVYYFKKYRYVTNVMKLPGSRNRSRLQASGFRLQTSGKEKENQEKTEEKDERNHTTQNSLQPSAFRLQEKTEEKQSSATSLQSSGKEKEKREKTKGKDERNHTT
jgi:hypothetical protein